MTNRSRPNQSQRYPFLAGTAPHLPGQNQDHFDGQRFAIYRLLYQQRESGQHGFDRECSRLNINHRLIPPRSPQSNGMVEPFNWRISEIVQQISFSSAQDLQLTLEKYLKLYNQHVPQKALEHITQIAALKNWQKAKPELLTKRVYDHAKLEKGAHILQPISLIAAQFLQT
jgi:hypothetical protein